MGWTLDPWRWALACGCDPMIEHCAQCDHRTRVVHAKQRLDRLTALRVKVAELESTAERDALLAAEYGTDAAVTKTAGSPRKKQNDEEADS